LDALAKGAIHVLTEAAADWHAWTRRSGWRAITFSAVLGAENARVAGAQVVAVRRRARVYVTAVALVVAVGGHRATHARAERHVGQVGALRLVVVCRHARAARQRVGGARVNKDLRLHPNSVKKSVLARAINVVSGARAWRVTERQRVARDRRVPRLAVQIDERDETLSVRGNSRQVDVGALRWVAQQRVGEAVLVHNARRTRRVLRACRDGCRCRRRQWRRRRRWRWRRTHGRIVETLERGCARAVATKARSLRCGVARASRIRAGMGDAVGQANDVALRWRAIDDHIATTRVQCGASEFVAALADECRREDGALLRVSKHSRTGATRLINLTRMCRKIRRVSWRRVKARTAQSVATRAFHARHKRVVGGAQYITSKIAVDT